MADTIFQKLDRLKKIYLTPEDQRELDTKEEALRALIKKKKFSTSEIGQELIKDAKNRITEISHLLQSDRTLTDEERKMLFGERDSHYFWLARINGEAEVTAIKGIHNYVDNQLNK
jgi:hypothetical protein